MTFFYKLGPRVKYFDFRDFSTSFYMYPQKFEVACIKNITIIGHWSPKYSWIEGSSSVKAWGSSYSSDSAISILDSISSTMPN